jgi:ribonuclease Z
VWNITKDKIVERMTVSPDQAWSVAGPTPPPKPPAAGTVPDPLSEAMKAGRWNPQAEDAQKELVDAFKKKYDMQ